MYPSIEWANRAYALKVFPVSNLIRRNEQNFFNRFFSLMFSSAQRINEYDGLKTKKKNAL